MEYLPGRFGIDEGPYLKLKDILKCTCNHHHCIIVKYRKKWYLTHRKTTGKWKKLKPQKIRLSV